MALLLVSACVTDWQVGIAIVKNSSSNRILIAKQPGKLMTDSILYNERFSETWIDTNKSQLITLPNVKLTAQPDSVKTYLFVFNCDSVDKFQASKQITGILKSSLIRKIEIQDNKIKEPLDTVYVK